MFSGIDKRVFFAHLVFLVLLTLTYTLLFNHSVISSIYAEAPVLGFLYSFFSGFVVWSIACFNRWLFLFLAWTAFFFGGLVRYASLELKTQINAGFFEMISIMDLKFIKDSIYSIQMLDLFLALYVGFAFIVLRFFFIRIRNLNYAFPMIMITLVCLLIAASLAVATNKVKIAYYKKNDMVSSISSVNISSFMPEKIYENLFYYVKNRFKIRSLYFSRGESSFRAASYMERKQEDKKLVILIVSNSTRRDHMSIFNYDRETTPKMKELGFVPMGDMYACETSSSRSIPCLVSAMNMGDEPLQFLKEPSLITLFKSVGFKTAWLSNKRAFLNTWTGQYIVAIESNYIFFNKKSNSWNAELYDTDILTPFTNFINDNANENAFVTIVLNGNYWKYSTRYPKESASFTPDCNDFLYECSDQMIINSYDNALHEIDNVIAKIVEEVKDRNATIYFTSDHGEYLGEYFAGYKHYLHEAGALKSKELVTVPFSIWQSERAKKNDSNILMINSHKDKPLTHDYIYHSVAHCSKLSHVTVDHTKSICSPQLEPVEKRFVTDNKTDNATAIVAEQMEEEKEANER